MSINSKIFKLLLKTGIITGPILVLATLFHFPIRIVDAFTNQPEAGFDISISYGRILFEPFLGLLLFYLRADLPVEEFIVLLIWTIIFLFFFQAYRSFRKKEKGHWFKNGLILWSASMLILISIWASLLLCLIFMPLPSNTIVNNTADYILVNAHSHTEHSHDGLLSQEGQLEWHRRNGFDAFFITDHNHHEHTLEAIQKQKEGLLPSKPVIVCGQEFSGSNHLILLGLPEHFNTRGLSDSAVINTVHAMNGVVITAHWFEDERNSLSYYTQMGADGYEIANQSKGLYYDRSIFREIIRHCKEKGLVMIGVCDYHGYGSAASVWTGFHIPNWHKLGRSQQEASIMDILRHRDQSKLKILLYQDRIFFDRNKLFFSPVYTITGYFRTLRLSQVLSWLGWILLFLFLKQLATNSPAFQSLKNRPIQLWAWAGIASGSYIIANGIYLWSRAQAVEGENDIYAEYGHLCLGIGAGLLLYALVLYFWRRRAAGS